MTHRRESSVHEVKETLDATISETKEGERCLNNYILKDIIGQGAYGTVTLAVDKYTGEKFAIKEFSKARLRKKTKANVFRRPRGRDRGRFGKALVENPDPSLADPLSLIRGEVAVLKKLNHQNVVKLFEVLDDEQDSLYMVFEMCEKGVLMDVTIQKATTPFSNEDARRYFRHMILGFEYLHEHDIVHRDIKPDNLLLSADGILKIVDFGVSEAFTQGNDKMKKSAGSPAFMAPELCVANRGEISGKAADIWSMGVTLYCLVFGHLPFVKDNVIDLFDSIKNDDITIPEGSNPDADLVDLLHKVLEKDPEKRIIMAELREHPWVTNRGSDPLISTEENCSEAVTEITDDDLSSAIKCLSFRGVIAVHRAVKQFKRMSKSHSHQYSAEEMEKLKKDVQDAEEKKEIEHIIITEKKEVFTSKAEIIPESLSITGACKRSRDFKATIYSTIQRYEHVILYKTSEEFESKERNEKENWYILDELEEVKTYETRVSYASTSPTIFVLNILDFKEAMKILRKNNATDEQYYKKFLRVRAIDNGVSIRHGRDSMPVIYNVDI
ncbi:Pkinase-domain-containing protein [Gigaspora margarita]|uniref:Pkinase-domain-containing protein n=1 Tax=Gigaspora margarita TaxID=4874 RepID=A0A8H3X9Q5_GIGMA|nr:Pkinase-domain-containing protein [Gigaspora margarita]